eukprot:10237550-Alexandrium_andersonii.AAC.1
MQAARLLAAQWCHGPRVGRLPNPATQATEAIPTGEVRRRMAMRGAHGKVQSRGSECHAKRPSRIRWCRGRVPLSPHRGGANNATCILYVAAEAWKKNWKSRVVQPSSDA